MEKLSHEDWIAKFREDARSKTAGERWQLILTYFPHFDFDKDYERKEVFEKFQAVIEECRFDLMPFEGKKFFLRELKRAYEDIWGNARAQYGDVIKYLPWEDENNKFRLGCEKYLELEWKTIQTTQTASTQFTEIK